MTVAVPWPYPVSAFINLLTVSLSLSVSPVTVDWRLRDRHGHSMLQAGEAQERGTRGFKGGFIPLPPCWGMVDSKR